MNRAYSRPFILVSAFATLVCFTNVGCLGDFSKLFNGEVRDRENIDGRDKDGIYPGLKLSWNLLPGDGPPRQGLFERVEVDPVDSAAASHGAVPLDSVSGAETPERVDPMRTVEPGQEAQTDGAPMPVRPNRDSRPKRRSSVEPRLSVNAEYSVGIGGDASDSLSVTNYVDYDGIEFLGPQRLDYRYDVHLGMLGVRGGWHFYDLVSLEGDTGLSVTALDLEIRGVGQDSTDTGVSLGVHLGGRVSITPHPVIDLYGDGRIHLMGGLQESRRSVVLSTAELGGNLHLTSNVSVFGGYRWWRYYEDIHHASDVDSLRLNGPTFGMLLRY